VVKTGFDAFTTPTNANFNHRAKKATIIERTDPRGSNGTIILTFEICNSGPIEYDIPSINRQGLISIRRVANDNNVICEALSTD
jgi:hypothetical protein